MTATAARTATSEQHEHAASEGRHPPTGSQIALARAADRRAPRTPRDSTVAAVVGCADDAHTAAGAPAVLDDDLLIAGDNLAAMATLPDGAFDMAYLDPPFNTGIEQRRGALRYADAFEDYAGFLAPRLERVRELLAPHGTLYLHLDYREAHRCKLAARRALRPRVLPQRADLDLRLRRPAQAPLAGEARHDPRLRPRPRPLPLRRRRGRPRAVHGARASSGPRRPRAASARATAGGTRSCRRTRARRPATRRRSRTASCAGWWRRRRARAAGAWTRSPARARSAPSAAALGRRFVLVDANPEAIAVCAARLARRCAARRRRSSCGLVRAPTRRTTRRGESRRRRGSRVSWRTSRRRRRAP